MRQAPGQANQQLKPASTGKRRMLASAVVSGLTLALAGAMPVIAQSKDGKLKVGLMLPYTGTFAALGTAIENGFRLHLNEQGGKLGGR
ncbi:MAG: ABC transporter permease, partial [Burkholderiaceae bacterium]